MEETDSTDVFKVSGRGELHHSVLIENMRREGYELAVSKPEVIMKKGEKGEKLEPFEELIISVPEGYAGAVISKLNIRKGIMTEMISENGYSKINYICLQEVFWDIGPNLSTIPGRRDHGKEFNVFDSYKGEIPGRTNGVAIAQETGNATSYALFNIQESADAFY